MGVQKIYFENYNINSINVGIITEKLKKLAVCNNNFNEDYLYSPSGIYKIINNSIYKLSRNDTILEKKTLNNKQIIIDKSSDQLLHNIYQIPFEHTHIKNRIYNYKLNNKSKLIFVLEEINATNLLYKYYNFYFILPENDKINDFIEQDIDTFLSVFY